MGIDMYIGEEQVRLSNAYYYNEFLNWVAMMGEFPSILDHSPIHGYYSFDEKETGEYRGNIDKLRKEVEELLTYKPPTYAHWILNKIMEAVEIAETSRDRITMDGGAWDGNT